MWKRTGIAVIFALAFFGPIAHSSDSKLVFIRHANGWVPCWPTSENFVMQDKGFCGKSDDKNFCMTSLACRLDSGKDIPAMATCRAHWTSPVPGDWTTSVPAGNQASTGKIGTGYWDGHPTCPSLQDCIDEPYQKLQTEDEAAHPKSDEFPIHALGDGPAPSSASASHTDIK